MKTRQDRNKKCIDMRRRGTFDEDKIKEKKSGDMSSRKKKKKRDF